MNRPFFQSVFSFNWAKLRIKISLFFNLNGKGGKIDMGRYFTISTQLRRWIERDKKTLYKFCPIELSVVMVIFYLHYWVQFPPVTEAIELSKCGSYNWGTKFFNLSVYLKLK